MWGKLGGKLGGKTPFCFPQKKKRKESLQGFSMRVTRENIHFILT